MEASLMNKAIPALDKALLLLIIDL